MSTLEIRFFGECQFIYDGQPVVGLQTKRMRGLLGYLVLHAGQQIAATHLAFLFWPDSSEKQARTNLRRAFYNLRQVFPESDNFLVREDHTVCWRTDTDCVIDVGRFEAHIARSRQMADGLLPRTDLEEAIACYRGDLLPDCYDDWIAPIRERLRQEYLHAIEQVTDLLKAEGDYPDAIRYGEVLVRKDPLRERSYHNLIQLYMLVGDRPAALRTYHACASELARELGVEPAEELNALYTRLLEQPVSGPIGPAAPAMPPAQWVENQQLVGRRRERRQLFAAWRAAAAGRAGCVLIRGEAGIGKTRLAEELYRWTDHLGIANVRTRAYAGAATLAYAPVVGLLRTPVFAPRLAELDPVRMAELSRLVPEIGIDNPDLPAPQPLVESWQRTRLFEALAYTICMGRQPLLLWIDDIQWCDAESLTWLHYLFQYNPQAPLLLLATVRDDELDADHPLRTLKHTLQRDARLTLIDLARLSPAETMELGRLISHDQLDDADLARHSAWADGNPLFMLELTRASQDAMLNRPVATTPSPLGDEPDHAVPPKVYSVIQARLAQLSPPARALAELAATIGRNFTVDLLLQAGHMPENDLVQALDELWRRRMIRESDSRASDYAYDFSHDRLRDVAYAEISIIRRRHYHAAVAAALERTYPTQGDDWNAELAHHHELAGHRNAAVGYYRQAGRRAAAQFAQDAVIDYATRALALIPAEDTAGRYALHSLRERAYHVQAAHAAQTQELDAMLALADAQGDAAHRADVHLRRAELAEVQGDYTAAIALVQQATATGQQKIEAAIRLGSVYWNLGDYPRAETEYQRGLHLAQGDPQATAMLLLHSGALNAYYAPYVEAKRIIRQALAASQAVGSEEGQIWALNQLGFVITEQGEEGDAAAEEALTTGLQLARKIGHRTYIAKLSSNLAMLYDRQGRRAQALACLDESLAIARESGSARHQAFAHNYQGNILANQGNFVAADQAFSAALRLFRTIGYREGVGKTASELATLALVTGDAARAHEHAEEAHAIATAIGIHRDQAAAHTRAGYVLEQQGEWSAAAAHYTQAVALYKITGQQARGLAPAAGLARAALAQGNDHQALDVVESLLKYLQKRALDTTYEARWVYYTCVSIPRTVAHPRASTLHAQAGQILADYLAGADYPGAQKEHETHLRTFCNAFETPRPVE